MNASDTKNKNQLDSSARGEEKQALGCLGSRMVELCDLHSHSACPHLSHLHPSCPHRGFLAGLTESFRWWGL